MNSAGERIKTIPAISLSIACLIFAATSVFAGEAQTSDSSSPAQDTAYSYREDDIPETFFFPKEKARWDGSKVTMKEWYALTQLQREKFISEYMGMLRKEYGTGMEITGLDYLRALNLFSYYSNEKSLDQPPTKLIDRLLSGQGKIAPAAQTDRQGQQ